MEERSEKRLNIDKIRGDCHTRSRGEDKLKTKTRNIVSYLDNENYEHKPEPFMQLNNKIIARVYIMGRYGMLQCAANFSNGYGGKNRAHCGVIDDENHRINHCELYKEENLFDSVEKIEFNDLYSEDENKSMPVVEMILQLWDLGNGRNCMKI